MECRELLLRISDYIDGTLPTQECAAIEEHLSVCPKCRILTNTLKTTLTLSRSLYEVPSPVHKTLHRVLKHEWEIHKVHVSVGVPKIPFVELIEFKEQIKLSIILPGIKRENITLTATPEFIEINGFKKRPEGPYYLNEINYLPFSRKIKLPTPTNPSKVQATLKEGVLRITLPKI